MKVNSAQASEVVEVSERIRPFLARREAIVQQAVMADLLARWLAGFQVAGDSEATDTVRAALLAEHCLMVRALVPVNEAELLDQLRPDQPKPAKDGN
jgi:hypothetical protein